MVSSKARSLPNVPSVVVTVREGMKASLFKDGIPQRLEEMKARVEEAITTLILGQVM